MKFPDNTTVERYRHQYPEGCRVELISMDDIQAPPKGTRGTVQGVDDAGNLLVKWDSGSGLNVVLGVDEVKKLDVAVITSCNGKIQYWESKEEAEKYFLQAIANSQGNEWQRYFAILCRISIGKKFCSDSD